MKKFFKRLVKNNFQKIRIKLIGILSTNTNIYGNPIIRQPIQFVGKGKIYFGKNVQIGYFPSAYYYAGYSYLEARTETSEIIFGNGVISNNNLTVVADSCKIIFGDNVLIGSNVEIINSDFHNIHPQKRNSGNHLSKDVLIGHNVFIGSNVKIMKGVHIGNNSVIANGSIVFDDVRENTIARGNPAQFFKEIIE
jgi:galactoside O-acetyltransferase